MPIAEEAAASPLAEALFDLGDVTGVFFGREFISVTAAPGVEWRDTEARCARHPARPFHRQYAVVPTPPVRRFFGPSRRRRYPLDDPADAEIVDQIKELIETRVRPAVANDGGDIIYRGFQRGVVYLQMQGACAGCPSSSATLKNGIEQLLKHYVPEVTEVRAA